jgi:putative transposase
MRRRKVNVPTVLTGQIAAITKIDDGIWLVSFMQCDLGYSENETYRLKPLQNPFEPKVLPMSPV